MSNNFIVIFRALGSFSNNELEKALTKTKYNILTLPILKIKKINTEPIETRNAQAALVTSSNGLFFFSQLSKDRVIKLYTIGNVSKVLAEKFGYKNVIDCQGDSVKMFNVIKNNMIKENGPIIYVGAQHISLDLPKMLRDIGYEVKRYIVYKTEEVKKIDEKFFNLIKLNRVKWTVLMSKKGATNFNKIIKNDISYKYFYNIRFACLSEKIARVLSDEIKLKYFPKNTTLSALRDVILKNE